MLLEQADIYQLDPDLYEKAFARVCVQSNANRLPSRDVGVSLYAPPL
jgi:hypothetical protein